MNIAVMTDNPGLSGIIPGMYKDAKYLQIVDVDEKTFENKVIATFSSKDYDEIGFANKIVEFYCEGVICGLMNQPEFSILAEKNSVSRFNGTGMRAAEALRRMNDYDIDIIRDYIGGTGCHTGEGECDPSHEE